MTRPNWKAWSEKSLINGVNEYTWWTQQKLPDPYKLGEHYVAMFGHERSVSYPEGHCNAVFAERGIRPLPRLQKMANDSTGHAPDTLQLYEYLKKYDGIVASHTHRAPTWGRTGATTTRWWNRRSRFTRAAGRTTRCRTRRGRTAPRIRSEGGGRWALSRWR